MSATRLRGGHLESPHTDQADRGAGQRPDPSTKEGPAQACGRTPSKATLYKAVLHHAGNDLLRAYLETLGVYVSLLNGCGYCVGHHLAGLRRLLDDPARADASAPRSLTTRPSGPSRAASRPAEC